MIKKLTLIIILCTLLSGCSNTGATIPSTDETQPTTLSTETTQISTTVEVTTTSGSEISSTLNGVSYKLGEANTQYEASVIKISGTITNPSPEVDSFGAYLR